MPHPLTPEAIEVLRVVAPRVTIPELATAVVDALSTGRAVVPSTVHSSLLKLPANGPDFAAWYAICSAGWNLPKGEISRYLKEMLKRLTKPTPSPAASQQS